MCAYAGYGNDTSAVLRHEATAAPHKLRRRPSAVVTIERGRDRSIAGARSPRRSILRSRTRREALMSVAPLGQLRPGECVEAHSRAAGARAIAELRRQPVADEHLQRLPHPWHVGQPVVKLADIEQARMRL